MGTAQSSLFGDEDFDYDLDYIVNNPIPAMCAKQGSPLCVHVQNLRVPELGSSIRCFHCNGTFAAVDKKAYQERVANLWQRASQD